MKITITNYEDKPKTINVSDDILIQQDSNNHCNVDFEGNCLRVWVDGEIIYIYPKGGQRDTTDVVFMNQVISK